MTEFGDPLQAGRSVGDERIFARLYDQFAARLHRTALGLLDVRSDAEDVVHDVFVGVIRAKCDLTEIENQAAYLFTSLRHVVERINTRRRKERVAARQGVEAERVLASPETMAVAFERGEALKAAVRELPDEQREVVTLKIAGELTFAEIAETLGISANTAASRYRYALEKLRTSVTEKTK